MSGSPARGLTLIELLIVVAIVALLAALVISQLQATRDAAKVATTASRMTAVTMGLAQIGMEEGSLSLRLQQCTEFQPSDSEPGLGGVVAFGPADATGLPTIGKRPPPLQSQNYGDWGYRGRGHLAFPWGKKFPDPTASGSGPTLMGPERFRLRDLSPFNTRKLLLLAGMLPTKQNDPAWAQAQYQTNRGIDEPWNDAWGHPLVVASALYQPTWRTVNPLPTIPGWQDGAWPTPASATMAMDPSTPPIGFALYGPAVETPSAPNDRSARKAILDHMKLYQYNRSVYVAVAAIGPQAWIDDTALKSSNPTDWANSPTAPTTGALDALWSQANWVCQQATEHEFDHDWSELSIDNPAWKEIKDDYLTRSKHQADANRLHYQNQLRGDYARCLLMAPKELK
jgi:general secretion pathway protein G